MLNHPAVYRDFVSGFHVVRRSDHFWKGLSADLVIEQVLMRSLKTSGGLTRGRSFTEQQRLIWLLSMPACAETNQVMQELMGVKSNSGEQNKDMSKAKQKRDAKDTLVILSTFADRDPFSVDPNLRNIMTGVNADNAVNVDHARAIRRYCPQRHGNQRQITGSSVVPKLLPLLQSRLSGLKATLCR